MKPFEAKCEKFLRDTGMFAPDMEDDIALVGAGVDDIRRLTWEYWSKMQSVEHAVAHRAICAACGQGVVDYDAEDVAEQMAEHIMVCKKHPIHTHAKAAHHAGLREGITRFAHRKDGVQYVGTCGKTLAEALAELEEDSQ